MNETETCWQQALLLDGICPECRQPLSLHDGTDADGEGRVYIRFWFECTRGHYYHAEPTGLRDDWYPLWEGEE